ncbi:hypothetical protein PMAYCL1PPCAC_28344, partial [Pristionchus mayeri]
TRNAEQQRKDTYRVASPTGIAMRTGGSRVATLKMRTRYVCAAGSPASPGRTREARNGAAASAPGAMMTPSNRGTYISAYHARTSPPSILPQLTPTSPSSLTKSTRVLSMRLQSDLPPSLLNSTHDCRTYNFTRL